jgi:hypothetical protein
MAFWDLAGRRQVGENETASLQGWAGEAMKRYEKPSVQMRRDAAAKLAGLKLADKLLAFPWPCFPSSPAIDMRYELRNEPRGRFSYLVAYAERIVSAAHPSYVPSCDLASFIKLMSTTYSPLKQPVRESTFFPVAEPSPATSAAAASTTGTVSRDSTAVVGSQFVGDTDGDIATAASVAVGAALGVANSGLTPTRASVAAQRAGTFASAQLSLSAERRNKMGPAAAAALIALQANPDGEPDIASATAVATTLLKSRCRSDADAVAVTPVPVAESAPNGLLPAQEVSHLRPLQSRADIDAASAPSVVCEGASNPPAASPLAAMPSALRSMRQSTARTAITSGESSSPFTCLPSGRTSFADIYTQWHDGLCGQPALSKYSSSNVLTRAWLKSPALDAQVAQRNLIVTEMDRIMREEPGADLKTVEEIMVTRYKTFSNALKQLANTSRGEHQKRMGRPRGSGRGRAVSFSTRRGHGAIAVDLLATNANEFKMREEVDAALSAAFAEAGGVLGGDAAIDAVVSAAAAVLAPDGPGAASLAGNSAEHRARTAELSGVNRDSAGAATLLNGLRLPAQSTTEQDESSSLEGQGLSHNAVGLDRSGLTQSAGTAMPSPPALSFYEARGLAFDALYQAALRGRRGRNKQRK